MRRVVITGIGAVTPLGSSFSESWDSLISGISGISLVDGIRAGFVRGFDARDYLSAKEVQRLDPFVHYAVASSLMALEDAGLRGLSTGGAVIVGSGRGGIGTLERYYTSGRASAYMMSASTILMAASYISKKIGHRGISLGISNSCASGSSAIVEGFRLIKSAQADIAAVGGSDAPICNLSIDGYAKSGVLSKSGKMMPFDKKRDGFLLGEGASMLILEELSSAIRRGARIYAEVVGYAQNISPSETRPDSLSQEMAMWSALAYSGAKPGDIDFVNAHATSTRMGDASEAQAIKKVFGTSIRVTAIKSATGHMIGASGAFESATTIMGIYKGIVPQIINLSEPEFNFNFIRKKYMKGAIRAGLVNSFGFGGINVVLFFRAID